jgi:FO synthase
MTPDDVLEVAKAGERLGCKEALFSLGDRPEAAFGEMRDGLAGLGHKTTLSYLGEISRRVLEETGLLPHSNPGLMARGDMEAIEPQPGTDAREHQRTIEWARDGARQRSR